MLAENQISQQSLQSSKNNASIFAEPEAAGFSTEALAATQAPRQSSGTIASSTPANSLASAAYKNSAALSLTNPKSGIVV